MCTDINMLLSSWSFKQEGNRASQTASGEKRHWENLPPPQRKSFKMRRRRERAREGQREKKVYSAFRVWTETKLLIWKSCQMSKRQESCEAARFVSDASFITQTRLLYAESRQDDRRAKLTLPTRQPWWLVIPNNISRASENCSS